MAQQASRIHELELMMPGDDGQYKGLKQELKELENVCYIFSYFFSIRLINNNTFFHRHPQDCDFYFNLYKGENQAKDAAQKAIAVAIGQRF